MDRLVDTVQAARLLGVSRQWIHALVRQGRIAGAFRVGKTWAIPTPIRITRVRVGRPPRDDRFARDRARKAA